MQKIDFNKDWMCRCLTRDEEAYPVTLPHDAMLSEPRTQESTGEGNIGWYIGGDYEYTKNFFVAGIFNCALKPQAGRPADNFWNPQLPVIIFHSSEFHTAVIVQNHLNFTGNRMVLIFSDKWNTIKFLIIGSATDH